jgi:hypothetical protein
VPIGGALASAEIAKVGLVGYALAITSGIAVGIACAWMMRAVGKTVGSRIQRHEESSREWYFRALYFVVMLWIVLAGCFGRLASTMAMRLVF